MHVTTHLCRKCAVIKSLTDEYFPRDRSQKSGFKSLCLECRKAERKTDYHAQPEKFLAAQKASYLKHHESRLERNRAAYQANREVRDVSSKAWGQANPERRAVIEQASRERRRQRRRLTEGAYCSVCRAHRPVTEFADLTPHRGLKCQTCVLSAAQVQQEKDALTADRACVCCRRFRPAAAFGTTAHPKCATCRTEEQRERNATKLRERRPHTLSWAVRNPEANRAYFRIYQKQYRLQHPVQTKMRNAMSALRRSARRMMIEHPEQFRSHQLFALWESQAGQCRWCGAVLSMDASAQLDHIIPLSKGGDNRLVNLCWACAPCNHDKLDKMPHEFAGVLF